MLADALPVEPAPEATPPTAEVQTEVALPAPQAAAMLPVQIVFDGGSRGNPGQGYGSYQLTVRNKAETPQRLTFASDYTNNEAEYDTLIEALEAVVRRAKDPSRVQLDIRGDSQLIINQINGTWKAKDARMSERKEHVLALLKRMGSWRASWHPRGRSVKALGH
jgi:ribonuclease HI